ncbi:MAG: membrane protein insertase YidC [Candidatus Aminicenantes bacterium]|nr:membrane protein insertase YidC [Candidatus Aminicenantes bacterium]MBL7082258.1 membrane protein insertase YidC [Candidatus Aminicenantes bacterium]
MEKRVLVAIVLSFLVLVLYQLLFMKKPQQPVTPAVSAIESEKKPGQQIYGKETLPPTKTPQAKELAEDKRAPQQISAQTEKQILIDTSLYQAVWSNKGGVLKSWKLKKHKNEEKEDLELVPLHSSDLNTYPFSLRTDDSSFDNTINSVFYQSSNLNLELKEGQTGEVRLLYADNEGTRVEKILTFQGGKYDFDIQINVWKYGQKIEPGVLWGPGFGNPSSSELKQQRFGGGQGMAVFPTPKVKRLDERKFIQKNKWESLVIKKENVFYFVQWAAYENNYFTALFITSFQDASATFLREGPEEAPHFLLSVSSPQKVYIGPKDFDSLVEFGFQTKRLIRFGLFGFISEILLRASKFIHRIVPNWGLSIIILTLIIKIIFFPLTYSSMRSMAKMQELQPKIKALRAKYKKSKTDIAQRRKMNEEVMRLYKEQGVNPAGGCLPMLIQIPVFWGFFRLLIVAIEFRHSPFIFWITDLSVKDPFYVTPILMGLTQFISQKMTPTSADPAQTRMMLIMPFVFTFIFMSFPSGLVLYWLTNNVLQIGQQYIMNRLKQKKKRESHGKRRKK